MAISLKTHKMIWGRSANRCNFSSCRRQLVEDETETDDPSVVGDEAHIVAREEGGPRGISILTPEERDKYDNLILLCKIHHKIIDDQPITYTVSALQKLKLDHIIWVDLNLTPDVLKQKDEEIYATYVDKWIELADITNWQNWTSYIFSNGQPSMEAKQYSNLSKINEFILSRVWPKRYDRLEWAFNNFRIILNDFLLVFIKFKEDMGAPDDLWYHTRKFYRDSGNDKLLQQYNYHVDLVQDLAAELTRAANFLCDQIRSYLSNTFRIKEGVLLIVTGPDITLSWKTVRLEFGNIDDDLMSYNGLLNFMTSRIHRNHFFGDGVSNDYLPPNLI